MTPAVGKHVTLCTYIERNISGYWNPPPLKSLGLIYLVWHLIRYIQSGLKDTVK